MDLALSNYNEQFLKQSPLAVLGVLRDLHKKQVPIRLSWQSGQFISKILEVTAAGLIVDFGSQAQENQGAQKAANIQFTAETEGAKVEFILPKITAIRCSITILMSISALTRCLMMVRGTGICCPQTAKLWADSRGRRY